MNTKELISRKAQVGTTIIVFFLLLISIMVIALMSPATSPLFEQSADNAGLNGFEKLFFENFNVLILAVAGLTVFLIWAWGRGGD